jgi:hypothetical protein
MDIPYSELKSIMNTIQPTAESVSLIPETTAVEIENATAQSEKSQITKEKFYDEEID